MDLPRDNLTSPPIQQVPPEQLPDRRRRFAVAVVAAVSTAAAIAIEAVQRQPLGDEPIAMILVGCFLAILTAALRLGHPPHLGLAAMAGFPAWAVIDLVLHGGHTLLPFEFALYAIYGGLGVVAAIVGKALGALTVRLWRRPL
jgi:peptidoglycan/LPS O-acetylase OafA/YrhL